jgi:hypothetical protein
MPRCRLQEVIFRKGDEDFTYKDLRRILGLGDVVRHFKLFCEVQGCLQTILI